MAHPNLLFHNTVTVIALLNMSSNNFLVAMQLCLGAVTHSMGFINPLLKSKLEEANCALIPSVPIIMFLLAVEQMEPERWSLCK